MARPIILIPYLFQLADVIKFRNNYSPSSRHLDLTTVMSGVAEVFPEAEYREFMFHLVMNFKKRHHGKVFDDHLWPAVYS